MRLNRISSAVVGVMFAVAAGAASAQSSVTLYGVVDASLLYLNNGGKASVSMRSGTNSGSSVGLKGAEDLGGGSKAVFDVESGYNVNNGGLFADTNALFYRQAWVGLTNSKYGTLSFGRQYEPSLLAIYPSDPFRANEVLSLLAAAALSLDPHTLSTQYIAARASNSMLYRSPVMGGFQINAMYAFAATVTQPLPMSQGNVLDVAATYTGYGLYAGLSYQYQHSGNVTIPFATGAQTLPLENTEHFTAALAYQIGIVNLQANYVYTRPVDTQGVLAGASPLGTAHPNAVAQVGATIQASAADSIEVAAIDRQVRGVHDETWGFQLGYDHLISKRTTLYARAGYLKNIGTAVVSWPGYAAPAGSSQTMALVGISHRF